MKITNVRTAVIVGNLPWVLVRVGTDGGVMGLGEAYWGVGVAELVHRAKPLLIGQNSTNIARLMFVMERSLSGEGSQAGVTTTARSGIEIALRDLLARMHNLPISTLFRWTVPRKTPHLRRSPRGRHTRARRLRQAHHGRALEMRCQ